MAKVNVLVVQGAGDMWAPDGSGVLAGYLRRELMPDFDVHAPEMPDADDPRYDAWREAIDSALRTLNGPVMLVGHSLGASWVLRYLAETESVHDRIQSLFLVATPWWEPAGWSADYALPEDFGSRLPSVPIHLYHSREDPHVPFDHLAIYQRRLPTAAATAVDGDQHSFTDGLPQLVTDIRTLSQRET